MTMTLDHLDQQAAAVFDGYLVRKDLVRKYSRQYPVPTYVVEFLLEVISRSMFITVLGADLFMRLNLTAWKNEHTFAGKPEADQYNRIMGELERIT